MWLAIYMIRCSKLLPDDWQAVVRAGSRIMLACPQNLRIKITD